MSTTLLFFTLRLPKLIRASSSWLFLTVIAICLSGCSAPVLTSKAPQTPVSVTQSLSSDSVLEPTNDAGTKQGTKQQTKQQTKQGAQQTTKHHPASTFHSATLVGTWLRETNNELMLDPQTSGLSATGGYLYSVSDASAKEHQLRRLHVIDKDSGKVVNKLGPIEIAEHIQQNSCFAAYLNKQPDYEGLLALPGRRNQWLLVTEDGTRGDKVSGDCLAAFTNSHFTRYPALLVKVELINNKLILNGVRAIEFDPKDNTDKRSLGMNIENDGIEGLALTHDNRLLFGIEKDANGYARVFEYPFTDSLFDTLDTFIKPTDANLRFPSNMRLNNPINGMDIYYPNEQSQGYLITIARNNNQLWILDLSAQKPAIVVDLNLYAPSSDLCGQNTVHKIRNAALEGASVVGNTLYLINDPWKEQYPRNVTCVDDKPYYDSYAPLIFKTTILSEWFK